MGKGGRGGDEGERVRGEEGGEVGAGNRWGEKKEGRGREKGDEEGDGGETTSFECWAG